jgi:RNA polymerase sigma factor (sigma-70 family)
MERNELSDRLSRISTQWTMVFQAHGGSTSAAGIAQQELMQRYRGAVYRYLLGAVRNPDVAEDLAQEFALRLVRGDFRRADPQRGQFRAYVKTSLIHLVQDYYRARQAWPQPLSAAGEPTVQPAEVEAEAERNFLASWRQELLDRAWQALERAQPTQYEALRLRAQEPDLPSPQMAEQLAAKLHQPLTADAVRKHIERAHRRFAELLVDEVAASLDSGSQQDLERELRELDLLRYCRSALERRP